MGFYDDDLDASTKCVAVTGCAPGTFVAVEGKSTADTVCVACSAGFFAAGADAPSCLPYTVCGAGSYVETAGTTKADQVCTGCASGTFTTLQNQTSCKDWTDCVPGTHVTSAPTAKLDRTCGACAAGTVATTATPVTCPAGTWDDDGSAATPCVNKTTCIAGKSVAAEGTTKVDHASVVGTPTVARVCTGCASGTYTSADNQAACTTQVTCAKGTAVGVAGSPSTAKTCVTCDAGSYSDATDSAACTVCPAGTAAPAGSTSAAACVAVSP